MAHCCNRLYISYRVTPFCNLTIYSLIEKNKYKQIMHMSSFKRLIIQVGGVRGVNELLAKGAWVAIYMGEFTLHSLGILGTPGISSQSTNQI